jgi:zinc/manganese transport system substrate-binding protein
MIGRSAARAGARTERVAEALFLRLRLALFAALAGLIGAISVADAAPLNIVAAENFYGDIAQQIGGPDVAVTSILTNPDQDPHEFEARPSTARALAAAALVIYNGVDYDPWAAKLLASSPSASRQTIVVAALMDKKPGANPHIWYDPMTALMLARSLTDKLGALDAAHRTDFESRLAAFDQSLKPLTEQIAELRGKYAGTSVTATEPVFGYMADALGLKMRNRRFQLAVMNGAEPSAAEIAAFARDLRTKAVKLLIYNNQTSDALTRRMRTIAEQSGIPVVGVSETEPPGKHYQQWMRSQLDAIGRALAH